MAIGEVAMPINVAFCQSFSFEGADNRFVCDVGSLTRSK
jgi:hypothetical protein